MNRYIMGLIHGSHKTSGVWGEPIFAANEIPSVPVGASNEKMALPGSKIYRGRTFIFDILKGVFLLNIFKGHQ